MGKDVPPPLPGEGREPAPSRSSRRARDPPGDASSPPGPSTVLTEQGSSSPSPSTRGFVFFLPLHRPPPLVRELPHPKGCAGMGGKVAGEGLSPAAVPDPPGPGGTAP